MAVTVLVTGGAGFIGRACIAELLRLGYCVRATVRDHSREASVREALRGLPDHERRLAFVCADLRSDLNWELAVKGCRYVLHVASPLGFNFSLSDNQLIEAAVGGTLRVIKAAVCAGVERVVMTSAANAASPASYTEDGVTDEALWTDPDDLSLTAYRRSKTLAERAAWDFIDRGGHSTTLTTILPGAVIGPILSAANPGSAQIVGKLLRGEILGIPNIGLELIDVRDVVDLHIRAMTAPAAANERFLATGDLIWISEIASVLRDNFKGYSRRIPSISLPNVVMQALSLIQPELRELVGSLDRRHRHSIAKAQGTFGWRPRPVRESIVDCAKSLIELGVA